MDTDDLSQEAYKAVIIEGERFNHDLTLQFGVLSYRCENEEQYLLAAKEMNEVWKKDLNAAVQNIFYDDNPPSQSALKKAILKIRFNILEVEKIPLNSRKFDF